MKRIWTMGELLVETWSFAFAWVGAAALALLAGDPAG